MSEHADTATTRPRGRPRSAEAERAIIAAALEELAANGADGFSVEAVAARAHVGKTTIYRRWPNRDALILEALSALDTEEQPPAGGVSVRDDLVSALDFIRRRQGTSVHAQLLPRVLAASRSHPELMRSYQRRVIERRSDHMRALLRRGVESGELRADLDIELALQALVFPILHVVMTHTGAAPLPDDFAARLVDLLIDGLGG